MNRDYRALLKGFVHSCELCSHAPNPSAEFRLNSFKKNPVSVVFGVQSKREPCNMKEQTLPYIIGHIALMRQTALSATKPSTFRRHRNDASRR